MAGDTARHRRDPIFRHRGRAALIGSATLALAFYALRGSENRTNSFEPIGVVSTEDTRIVMDDVRRGDVDAVRRRFEEYRSRRLEPKDPLFSIWEFGQYARNAGRLSDARRAVDLLETLSIGFRSQPIFELLAQTERLEIAIVEGNLDEGAVALNRMRELSSAITANDDESRWARAYAAIEEVNHALAADDFDGAIRIAESLIVGIVEDPASAALRPKLLTKCALALVGQARRDPAMIERARDRLREILSLPDFTDADDRVRLGTMLVGLDLRVGDPIAAHTALRVARSDLERDPARVGIDYRLLLEAVEMRWLLASSSSQDEILAQRIRLDSEFDLAITALTDIGRNQANGFLHFSHMIEALSERIGATLVLEDERAALEIVFRTDEYTRLARPLAGSGRIVDAVMTEALVSDRHALLCLVPGTERAHLFVVTRSGVVHHERPDTAKLKQAWQEIEPFLHRPLSARDRERLAIASREAAHTVLGDPVIATLPNYDAISLYAPAGMNDLPFEHLAPEGKVLGRSHAIDRWPSPSLAVDLARRAPIPLASSDAPSAIVVEIAAPTLDTRVLKRFSSTGPLPFSAAELDYVTAAYPPHLVRRHVGTDATVAAFLTASKAQILSILAHGVWVPELTRPASIALATSEADRSPERPGILSSEIIESTEVPWLIALGVCGAGAGPRRLGNESALDLGGAFLFAGAGAVMLARGRVEATSTREVLASFHRHLASGTTPAEALRRARVDLDDTDRPESGTYAPLFEIIGAGHRPVLR